MKNLLTQASEFLLIGVLAILPVVIVIQVVLFIKQIIEDAFFRVYGYADSYLFTAMVFFGVVIALCYIGYTIVRSRRSIIISTVDLLIEKIPFLSTIYRVSKKVINMFTTSDPNAKKEVVYLEYPKPDVWVPAYVTNKSDDWFVLFVPTSPNPTSGFTVIIHESKIVKSKMSIEEATSFIVSVGADFPKSEEVLQLPR